MTNLYEHKKTGGIYNVISEGARMESDLSPVVVYMGVETGHVWVRPYHEFFDGRFEKL